MVSKIRELKTSRSEVLPWPTDVVAVGSILRIPIHRKRVPSPDILGILSSMQPQS